MSTYDQNSPPSRAIDRGAVAIDAGLRDYMLRIYNYMAAGVGLTALVAWLTYQLTGPALLQNPLMWVFIFAPLVLVFFISARINTLSVEAARVVFLLCGPGRDFIVDHLPHLHAVLDHAGVLYLGGGLRRAQYLGLHHTAKLVRIRNLPVHGPDRHHYR